MAPTTRLQRTVQIRQSPMTRGEICVYALVVTYALYTLFTEGVSLSDLLNAKVHIPQLTPGWIPSRQNDVSDHQWREFRSSMPLLATALAGFAAVSRAIQAVQPSWRLPYLIAFSLVLQLVLHGACAGYVLILLLGNYCLARAVAGKRFALPAIWAYNCGTLLAARILEGFAFGSIAPGLAILDGHRGMLRWHIHYNLLVLRMISFGADLHWATTRQPPRTKLPADTPPSAELSLRDRTELPVPLRCYSLATYVAHTLYPPLYIAGPTITYNNFASQLQAPAASLTPRATATYAARLLLDILTTEIASHFLYFNAIAKYKLWVELQAVTGAPATPMQTALIGFWVIFFTWLKFLVIWRFFRLFALAEGIDPPENMSRCVLNNYDIEGFWKNWHASYNLWLVRYLYIPLGGGRWRLANVWVVFTFVAVWHDLEWRLLSWAWIMALFMAPEMAVKWLGRQKWCLPDKTGRAFRYAAAAAAAANILVLLSANLVGFVVGLEGLRPLAQQVFSRPTFVIGMLGSFFAAAQLMFAIRDWEAARAAPRAPPVLHKP